MGEQKVEININHYIFDDRVTMTATCNIITGRTMQDCNHFNILQKEENGRQVFFCFNRFRFYFDFKHLLFMHLIFTGYWYWMKVNTFTNNIYYHIDLTLFMQNLQNLYRQPHNGFWEKLYNAISLKYYTDLLIPKLHLIL